MLSLHTILLLLAAALGALAWIGLKLNRAFRPLPVDAGWWEHFQPEKYRPLSHLFDDAEVRFLRSYSGAGSGLLWGFRRERARICLLFLREMQADFERLQAVGQALVVANRCSPGLQDELFRQRVRFSLAWWRMRVGLLAWRLGLAEPDGSVLVQALERSAASVRLALSPAG